MVITDVPIKKQYIDKNYTKGIIINPQYIVVHDTDNRDFGSTAKFNRDYLAVNSKVKTSAHYIVDDKNIIQLLEDRWRGWHVGDKANNIITNSNSIAVKMCVNRGSNIEKTMNNMLYIIKKLMRKYDIPAENVVRHYDVTGKICPRMMIEDNPSLWTSLKEAIENDSDEVVLYRIIEKGMLNPVLTKLNIKACKDRKSENIGILNKNEEIIIYEFDGDWLKIITKDNIPRFGYVKRDFINIIDDLAKKRVLKIATQETKADVESIENNEVSKNDINNKIDIIKNTLIDTEISQPTEIETSIIKLAKNITESVNSYEKRVANDKAIQDKNNKKVNNTITDKSTKKLMDNIGVVSSETLNLAVRKGPADSYYVISYLLPGEKVKVIEQSGEWYQILYESNRGERFGYVESQYIDLA